MDIETGTHEFILSRPIMVKFDGEGAAREIISLELVEPTRQHLKRAARLKQMIMGAMMEASKLSESEQPTEYDPDKLHEKTPETITKESEDMRNGINIALVASQSIDLGEFQEIFIDMATRKNVKPIVLCENEIQIKESHFDDMHPDDIERLAITYASFFCMPSVLKDL